MSGLKSLAIVLLLCLPAQAQPPLRLNHGAYRANAAKWGATHGAALVELAKQADTALDPALGACYYDAPYVYQQLAAKQPAWQPYIDASIAVYRDKYVMPNNGAMPGYWNFTDGLRMHWQLTKDEKSKAAVIALSKNAAFAQDGVQESWTADYSVSREVAYSIIAMLNAEECGEPRRDRLALLVRQAMGHIDQWFVHKTATNYQPFMVGLTASALIRASQAGAADEKEVNRLLGIAADWLWANAWRAKEQAFYEQSITPKTGAPDLNLLIFPLYAWLAKQTREEKYRDQAEAIFNGGVAGAYLSGPKQFNQNYQRSTEALYWLVNP